MSFLQKTYSRDDFVEFLKNDFISDYSADSRSVSVSDKSLLKDVQKLGGSEKLGISVFEAKCDESDHGKRVAITQDAFRVLRDTATRNALIVFYSEKKDNWRISLLTSTFDLKNGKVVSKMSNPKRYSYLLGPGAKTVTPNKFLLKNGMVADFEDLQKRFSVEVVNNEFYKEIAKLYDQLVGTEDINAVLKYPNPGEESHQFAVRLIGRIVFCWFLREKHSNSGIPLISKEILSSEAAKGTGYYHTILAPVFFEVLNKHIEKRTNKFRDGAFGQIPYLNGGLFSPQYDDHYKFDSSLELSVPGLVNVPDEWIRSLFELLETYNFTVDENTSVDIDLSIDPEMLGRIFENLLARINPETGETVRKATGSFYTPREVVEYMVDESLVQYLSGKTNLEDQKLRALVSYDLSDDLQHPLLDEEKRYVVKALGEVKILDPACGSGAFPIGILQKIVFILQQIDSEAKLWFEDQIANTAPEVRTLIEREFEHKNFDYIRKLGVIRESIFGIDIQPIATEIARLRCFLTLVVDERVNDSEPNRGVEPLPNLDFKFVTANSLIKLNIPSEGGSEQAGLFEDQSGIDELKQLRDEYFNSHNSERDAIKFQFSESQKRMLQNMIANHSHGFADLTQKLSSWDPFSHHSTNWFDPEWMFGINSGFDITIANPPYIQLSKEANISKEYKDKLKETFGTSGGRFNTFIFFIHYGISALKDGGILTYIIPNTLLTQTYYKETRKYLIERSDIVEIVSYPVMQFKSAVVENITFVARKKSKIGRTDQSIKISIQDDNSVKNIATKKLSHFSVAPNYTFELNSNEIIDKIFSTDHEQLHDYCHINQAIALKGDRKASLVETKLNSNCYPVLDGRDINKYSIDWSGKYLNYDITKIHSCKRKDIFESKEKLFFRRVSKNLIFSYDDQQYFALNTLVVVNLKSGANIGIKYLLGLLNSKLMNYIYENKYKSTKKVFSEIQASTVGLLPIVVNRETEVVALVDKLMQDIKTNPTTKIKTQLEEIDKLVYQIYNLSPEEIKIVENSPLP